MIWQEQPVRGEYPDMSVLALSGVEQMRWFLRAGGPRPPIHYLTGLRPTEAGVGSSAFVMPATKWLSSPQGLVSAGALAILADAVLGCAVQTTLPPATLYTTTELTINMLRPIAADGGLLTARGSIVHAGKSVALSDCFVFDSQGRVVAHGSSRCYIFPPFDDVPEPPTVATWVEPSYDGPHPFEREAQGELVPVDEWRGRSGLEILEGHADESLPRPPIHYLTGLRPTGWSDGTCSFVLPATQWLTPPHGNIEGGAIALVADSAIAGAIQTTVPAGHGYATLDLKVYFTRPVPPDGTELTATAEVINRGRNMAIASCRVTNSEGKKVALASGSGLIVDRPVTSRHPIAVADEEVAPPDD
ncbi:MAG: PaaI family thioesterase [Actinomycetota bacterium]|nr:PaaI family thioesterase [Actinomycetota bacterium]